MSIENYPTIKKVLVNGLPEIGSHRDGVPMPSNPDSGWMYKVGMSNRTNFVVAKASHMFAGLQYHGSVHHYGSYLFAKERGIVKQLTHEITDALQQDLGKEDELSIAKGISILVEQVLPTYECAKYSRLYASNHAAKLSEPHFLDRNKMYLGSLGKVASSLRDNSRMVNIVIGELLDSSTLKYRDPAHVCGNVHIFLNDTNTTLDSDTTDKLLDYISTSMKSLKEVASTNEVDLSPQWYEERHRIMSDLLGPTGMSRLDLAGNRNVKRAQLFSVLGQDKIYW